MSKTLVQVISKQRICDMLEKYCSEEWNDMIDMHLTVSEYDTGVKIFSEGQDSKSVQIIETGRVKIVTKIKGDDKIIRLASDGRIIVHRGFGGNNTYSVSAVALSPVTVKNIPRKIFDNVLKANPEFCFHFMMFFAEELRRSENHMKSISNSPVKNRVALALFTNMEAFGFDEIDSTKLKYSLSRKEIANFASTTYESVIRTLSELNNEGIVDTAKKSIYILDRNALSALSN